MQRSHVLVVGSDLDEIVRLALIVGAFFVGASITHTDDVAGRVLWDQERYEGPTLVWLGEGEEISSALDGRMLVVLHPHPDSEPARLLRARGAAVLAYETAPVLLIAALSRACSTSGLGA